MKNVFIFLVFLTPLLCKGQTEFAPVGAKWAYKKTFRDVFSGEVISEEFITISSKLDTIISGLNCRQILVKEILMDEGLEFKDSSFICQNNDSVFQITNEEFRLLFNFSLEKNDTLFVDSTKSLFYTIDTAYLTTIESKTLKAQRISIYCRAGAFPLNEVTLIEQIGPVESSLPPFGDQTISYLLYPDYECLQDVVPTIEFICYTENSWAYNPDNNPLCELLTSNNNVKRVEKSNFFKVYPNPFSAIININAPTQENITIMIHDFLGRQVFRQKYDFIDDDIELDLHMLTKGTYVLTITVDHETISKTIIKQ